MKNLLLLMACLFSAFQANASVFGFAADTGNTNGVHISQGYQGFNYGGGWGNNSWVNDTKLPISANYGVSITPLGAAWSDGGTGLELTRSNLGELFDFYSVSLNVGYSEDVTLKGFKNGVETNSWTGHILNQFAYTDITLNWLGVDKVTFSNGANLFVTNLNTSSVPLPAAIWLFGSAMAGFGWLGRGRSKLTV